MQITFSGDNTIVHPFLSLVWDLTQIPAGRLRTQIKNLIKFEFRDLKQYPMRTNQPKEFKINVYRRQEAKVQSGNQLQQNIFRQPEVKGGRAKDPPGKFDFESPKIFSNHLMKNILSVLQYVCNIVDPLNFATFLSFVANLCLLDK